MAKRWLLRTAVALGVLVTISFCAWWISLRAPVYIRLVLAVAEHESLMRDAVNWPVVRREVLEKAAGARTPADTYPAIWHLIRQLNDGHSHLIRADMRLEDWRSFGFYAMHPENVVARVFVDSPAGRAGIHERDVIEQVDGAAPTGNTEIELPRDTVRLRVRSHETNEVRNVILAAEVIDTTMLPAARMRGDDVGYLDLPQALRGTGYEETLLRRIRELDQRGARAWLVDLRRCEGGDMWVMLRGLRPIIGEGTLGYHVRPESDSATVMHTVMHVLTAGYLMRPGTREAWVLTGEPEYRLRTPDPPVAVLLSRRTASAGENVAVAFKGLARVRSFGEPTYGQTVANLTIPLPDGALLNLADAVSMDRTGRVFRERVPPDEPIAIDWQRLGQTDDPVLDVATTWLHSLRAPDRSEMP